MFRADEIETAVLDYLHRLVDTPEFAVLARGELEQLLSDDGASLEARLGEIEQRQRELDRQMDWLIEEAARQPGLRARFDQKCAAWEEQRAALQQEAERLRQRLTQRESRIQEAQRVRVVLEDFARTWGALDCDERREMAHLLLETAVARQGEGEAVVQLKAPFLPEQEVRLPMRHWSKRPLHGPLALTTRECEVLYLRGQGLSHAEIAQRWGTRTNASAVRVGKALGKLGVTSVDEALDLAGDRIARVAQALPADRRTGGRRAEGGLTPREREFLPLLADLALTYGQIADQLGVRPTTATVYAVKIARKLGVQGRAGLAAAVGTEQAAEPGTAQPAVG
jgi:DNA-binding CsgD family transcriptional regulator